MESTRMLLTLLQLKGIGPSFIKKESRHIQQLSIDALEAFLVSRKKPSSKEQINRGWEESQKTIDLCQKEGIDIITLWDADFPTSFFKSPDAPILFYGMGNRSILSKSLISLCGTSQPDRHGGIISQRTAAFFATEGLHICSSLQDGIEAQAAFSPEALKLGVVGILHAGLAIKSTLTPLMQQRVAEVVAHNGLVLSIFPPLMAEESYSFLKANRLQALLSRALIMVQAGREDKCRFLVKSFFKLPRILGVIQTIEKERELPHNSANKLIIEHKSKGVLQFVDVKTSKEYRLRQIISLAGKEDYPMLLNAVNQLVF